MFGPVLLILASSFGTFAVFRMFQRTGHEGPPVFITGLMFVATTICSFVSAGALFWSVYFQSIGSARVALVSLLILMVCCVVSTGMVLFLSLKEWPENNLD